MKQKTKYKKENKAKHKYYIIKYNKKELKYMNTKYVKIKIN